MGSFKLGKITFGSLFKKAETVQYPVQTKTPPPGLKGIVCIDVKGCILCGICQKCCPAGAITVDKKERTWTINRFRCVQCGSCVRSCPKKTLFMEPKAPSIAGSISSIVETVPEKEAKPKPKSTEPIQAIEPTGDPAMDAKLAKLPPEKAAKVRAAFMAKQAKAAKQ